MVIHGTASQLKVDGAYVEFQLAVLRALPRDINPDIADGWRNNGQTLAKVLREVLLSPGKPESISVPQREPLLVPIGTTIVSASTTPFTAKDCFVVNTKRNEPIKIDSITSDFESWFQDKVEPPFEGSTLQYGDLSHTSLDGSIIAALGGEEKAETTLAEVFALMSVQANDEAGAILTNGNANIFYVRDAQGELRGVHLYWIRHHNAWHVSSFPLLISCGWDVGDRVFFHDSR